MNLRFTIRAATVADVACIVQLNHALFQEDAGQRDPTMNLNWALEEGERFFAGFLKRAQAVVLLVEAGGGIQGEEETTAVVGYLAGQMRHRFQMRPINIAELESMYISEPYRNLGLGTQLVAHFRDWAEQQGAERIAVTAYAANTRALAFYQRLGFVPRDITLEMTLEIVNRKLSMVNGE